MIQGARTNSLAIARMTMGGGMMWVMSLIGVIGIAVLYGVHRTRNPPGVPSSHSMSWLVFGTVWDDA